MRRPKQCSWPLRNWIDRLCGTLWLSCVWYCHSLCCTPLFKPRLRDGWPTYLLGFTLCSYFTRLCSHLISPTCSWKRARTQAQVARSHVRLSALCGSSALLILPQGISNKTQILDLKMLSWLLRQHIRLLLTALLSRCCSIYGPSTFRLSSWLFKSTR